LSNVSKEEINRLIVEFIANELDINPDEVKPEVTFHNQGLNSVNSLFLLNALEDKYGVSVKPIYLWDYPTVRSFTEFFYTFLHESK